MRLIGNLPNENLAKKFTNYLASIDIETKIENSFDAHTGHMTYEIWVHNEDQIEPAIHALDEFKDSPFQTKYNVRQPQKPIELEPIGEPEMPAPHRFGNTFTLVLMALCILVFFLNSIQQSELKRIGFTSKSFVLTPIQYQLMFDVPSEFDDVQQLIETYSKESDLKIPDSVVSKYETNDRFSYFRGFYNFFVEAIKEKKIPEIQGPFFTKIKEGQFWRLVSPCILHNDLLHILFNMLWLWYLGKPIEQRIGSFRTLAIMGCAAVGSNVFQYLMSGPFFIGFSGVVTALAGFIWTREKLAPWEGYPLNKSTLWFLLIFVLSIFGLQLVAFFIQVFSSYSFSPNIANSAHIVGGLIGMYLGKFSYFAQRVHK